MDGAVAANIDERMLATYNAKTSKHRELVVREVIGDLKSCAGFADEANSHAGFHDQTL
jgi:hypothetical protein